MQKYARWNASKINEFEVNRTSATSFPYVGGVLGIEMSFVGCVSLNVLKNKRAWCECEQNLSYEGGNILICPRLFVCGILVRGSLVILVFLLSVFGGEFHKTFRIRPFTCQG